MQLVLGHLSMLPVHQTGSSSAIITVLQHCSSPSALEQAHGRLIYVGDQSLLPGRHFVCQIVEPWPAREGFKKYTEVRTNPDPNRSQSHPPIVVQKRPHLRPKSGPAGTFCETKMSSPGETKMSSPGETPNCFSIVKASPGGGADCLTRRAHFGLVFCSPVRGPALLLVSPKGSSSRTRAAPCLASPSPSTKLLSLGPLPRFVLCHQTRIRWSVSSAGRAVVVSRPGCLVAVCPCLSDTPAARRQQGASLFGRAE